MPVEMRAKSLQITFVLPSYVPSPIGGYRIVYQYANYLAARGHALSVLFPRFCTDAAVPRFPRSAIGKIAWAAGLRLKHRPLVDWQRLHPGVKLRLVRDVSDRSVADADAIFATAWDTAGPVARLSPSKGAKFYLIQHHETWAASEAEVNATWLLPLHKIVIAGWLLDLGERLGATDMVRIPNAIEHDRFRITGPADRRDGICALYNTAPYKGALALLDVLARFHAIDPAIPIRLFGQHAPPADLQDWIEYHLNPDQRVLVEDIYNRSLVYVSASVAEGWALPPAEAMACGCLFVGTDIGGFRDYAEHGVTALLSPPGDRDALLRNLLAGIADSGLRTRLALAGMQKIAEFTWDASGRAMEDTVRCAVEREAAARRARGARRSPQPHGTPPG
jgi:glycosyltransferase involved in cell wall biosynthesis